MNLKFAIKGLIQSMISNIVFYLKRTEINQKIFDWQYLPPTIRKIGMHGSAGQS